MSDVKITIDTSDADAFLTKLRKMQSVAVGLKAGLLYLKGKASIYPPERHGEQPFVSDEQRRGFFGKLKKGEIEVPYRRGQSASSERLAQRWAIRVDGFRGVLGNNASYAGLVHSRKEQSFYHKKTGWKTVEQIAKAEGPAAARIVRIAIVKDLQA